MYVHIFQRHFDPLQFTDNHKLKKSATPTVFTPILSSQCDGRTGMKRSICDDIATAVPCKHQKTVLMETLQHSQGSIETETAPNSQVSLSTISAFESQNTQGSNRSSRVRRMRSKIKSLTSQLE